MEKYGSYQTVQELARTGLTVAWTARRADGTASKSTEGDAPYVVKAFQPTLDVFAGAAIQPAIGAFLDRAQMQHDVAAAAMHWAPIHDLGRTEQGAYSVSDYYPRTAQRLVRSKVKVSGPALYQIVHAVLQGLREFRQSAGRSHGDLKLSNVLIAGNGDLARAKVVITDPAAEGHDLAHGGEAGDLQALGALIHQLVLYRPPDGQTDVPASPEWQRLGGRAGAWRELCNGLLNPEPDSDLLTLDGTFKALRNVVPRRRVSGTMVGLLLVVLAGLAIGAGFYYQHVRQDWRALCTAHDQWLGGLEVALADNDVRSRYRADPGLKSVVDRVEDAERNGTELDPSRIAGRAAGDAHLADFPPLAPASFRKVQAALQATDAIRQALAQSPLRQRWEDRRKSYAADHLYGPEQYVGKLLTAFDDIAPTAASESPGNSANLPAAIDALAALETTEQSDWSATEAASRQLQTAQQRIDSTGDAVLSTFANFSHASVDAALASGATHRDRGLAELHRRLTALAELAGDLGQFVATTWQSGQIDKTRFAQERTLHEPYTEQTYRDWLDQANLFVLRPTDGAPIVAGLGDAVEQARHNLATLKAMDSTQAPSAAGASAGDSKKLEDRLTTIAARVDQLRGRPWVVKDSKASAGSDVADDLKRLNADMNFAIGASAGNAQDWLKRVSDIGAKHASIDRGWSAKLKDLLAGRSAEQLQQTPVEFRQLQERVQSWQDVLTRIDRELPPPPALPPAFQPAISQKWNQAAEVVLNAVKVQDGAPVFPSAAMESERGTLQTWSQHVSTLASESLAVNAAFDAGQGLDEPAAPLAISPARWEERARNGEIATRPLIAAALAPTLKRIADLQAATTANPAQLAASADRLMSADATDIRPEIAVATLRRLLAGPAPTTADTFDREVRLRKNLDSLLAKILKVPARREIVAGEIARAGSDHWMGFVNTAGAGPVAATAIDSALAQSEIFGITHPSAKDAATLQPAAKYNLRLVLLRRHVARADATTPHGAILSAIHEARDSLHTLPSDLATAASASTIDTSLADLEAGAPIAAGPADPWRLQPVAGDDPLRRKYLWQIDPSTQRQIEFVMVSPAEGASCYLCTTETPVELLLDLAAAQPSLGRMMADNLAKAPATGPRCWEWSGDSIEKALYWLPDPRQPTFDLYASGLQDTRNRHALRDTDLNANPTSQHPLQQISAQAAVTLAGQLGCRLPTPTEWLAAYQKYEAPNPSPARNLRDQTWTDQLSYVASLPVDNDMKQALSPAAGIFLPTGANDSGSAYPQRDGTLLFQKIESDRGRVFHHLVGNVAEFTRDDAGQFYVLGGSSLGPPAVQVDHPYPIDPRTADARGYSDVGLRLAFPAPQSDGERLRGILARAKFVTSPAPSATP